MKTSIKTLIAAALTGTALFTALPALAHDGGWDRYDDRGHGHWRHHHHHRHHRHYVEYDRVVVRERPVYRSYYAPAAPVYYAPPPVRYADPAVVVGVSLPPVVIPLR
jgi:hypothetical protein